MIYVTDVAEALRMCAETELDKNFYAFNVGTAKAYKNNEILQKMKDMVGEFEIHHAPDRPGDVKHTLLNIVNIADAVGWKAQVTLDEGLRRTLEWWQIPLRN